MTVKRVVANDATQDQNSYVSDLEKAKDLSSPELILHAAVKLAGKKCSGGERETEPIMYGKTKSVCGELETDQESAGSSEEMESPKSVARFGRWNAKDINVHVHSQILRIREEDSHLGEDVGECLGAKDKLAVHHVESRVDYMLFSRPILPASPLGGKTTIKTTH
ncbi:unnamed protein product [Ilex paraguariensis]|uniref:Uncharacterized protein n=1 Tax=Ilex paraguariensis TaxID=185542 RepID=A0ABC8T145_9AQUA